MRKSSLADALALGPRAVAVADIGAAFFGEQQLYQPLIEAGVGGLICFEPDEARIADLRRHLGDRGQVFPFALGDGGTHTLHIAPGGMTSLLEPDQEAYSLYTLFAAAPFSPVASSITTAELRTRRLDDLDEVPPIDLLKVDVQGSELMILQNAARKLADCAAIQVEVPFVPLYKRMPTFGEIDAELRRQGFMVHGFASLKRLPLHPYGAGSPLAGINQLVDLDMVYVRDLRRMDRIPDAILRKTAVIADACYQSFDLAQRCLAELGRRRSVPAEVGSDYAALRAGGFRVGTVHMTPAAQPAA